MYTFFFPHTRRGVLTSPVTPRGKNSEIAHCKAGCVVKGDFKLLSPSYTTFFFLTPRLMQKMLKPKPDVSALGFLAALYDVEQFWGDFDHLLAWSDDVRLARSDDVSCIAGCRCFEKSRFVPQHARNAVGA